MGPPTHIGQEELGKVRMISCQDRVMQLKLNHVFNIFHNISPEYLKLHFTRVSSVQKKVCIHCIGIIPEVAHLILLFQSPRARLSLLLMILPFITGTLCQMRLKTPTIEESSS